jgi:hypothetical protein
MRNKKEDFRINRPDREQESEASAVDRFVSGVEPEVTKTFRLPARLSRQLKIHAAQTGQTEKEILIRLISDYLAANA